jgi:hypothetical protein
MNRSVLGPRDHAEFPAAVSAIISTTEERPIDRLTLHLGRSYAVRTSVAHESRILAETLGLVRMLLSRKVSLHSSSLICIQ